MPTIYAYTYKAADWCSDCIADEFRPADSQAITAEDVLDEVAASRSIDRDEERSFDTDDFPKPVFSSMTDAELALADEEGNPETCGGPCKRLILDTL